MPRFTKTGFALAAALAITACGPLVSPIASANLPPGEPPVADAPITPPSFEAATAGGDSQPQIKTPMLMVPGS